MPILDDLEALFDDAADDLPAVAKRRMFGCQAWFADGAIFGLIWKEGRIGVRLPDEGVFAELMGMAGADPWRAGDRAMAHWVLVPEEFHDDEDALRRWVERAHGIALAAPPKKTRAPAKKVAAAAAPAKRATAKRATAKR